MCFFQAPVPFLSPVDLTGKIAIITGGNAGLGFASTRQLLISKASRVILACRNLSKGNAAIERLLADSEVQKYNPGGEVEVRRVDMESYASVLGFAHAIKEELPALDILLLNAGIGQLTFETAGTGHEKVMQVNYLSNALLALELLPLLKSTAERIGSSTRMSWVGSRQHAQSTLIKKQPLGPEESVLGHFDNKAKYRSFAHYGNTKLLCVMFITEMVKKVNSDEVIVNSMCPGMVDTAMSDVLPLPLRVVADVVKKMRARTPQEGARITANAAVVVGKESHGRFLMDMEVQE